MKLNDCLHSSVQLRSCSLSSRLVLELRPEKAWPNVAACWRELTVVGDDVDVAVIVVGVVAFVVAVNNWRHNELPCGTWKMMMTGLLPLVVGLFCCDW